MNSDPRAQAQRGDFFRQARDVRRAVEALEDAFCGLASFPEDLSEAMQRLGTAASDVAFIAQLWGIFETHKRSAS